MKRNIIIAAMALVVVIGTGTVVGINAHHNAGDKEKAVINEGVREETYKETNEEAREETKEAMITDMKLTPDNSF